MLLIVHRDRDGASYSNRRVIAVQFDYQAHSAPVVTLPEELPDKPGGRLLMGVERRIPIPGPADQHRPRRVVLQESLFRIPRAPER